MDALRDLLYTIGSFCARIIRTALDWFMALPLLNKLIIINTLIAFLGVTLPIAKYYIFESWTGINNPVAVYMIFIVMIMFGTIFLHGMPVLAVRVIINLWYLISVIYIGATHTISHAPYVLSAGYFFNIAAPVIYIILSAMVFVSGDY